jgi:hypothetical protein
MVWNINGNQPSESSPDTKTISGMTPPCRPISSRPPGSLWRSLAGTL